MPSFYRDNIDAKVVLPPLKHFKNGPPLSQSKFEVQALKLRANLFKKQQAIRFRKQGVAFSKTTFVGFPDFFASYMSQPLCGLSQLVTR